MAGEPSDKRRAAIFVAVGAVVVVAAVAGFFVTRNTAAPQAPSQRPPAPDRLGLIGLEQDGLSAPTEQAELAALESGEARKNIEAEIEKAEKLLSKYPPGLDEHRMLSRRVAMLKKLKEKLGR